METLLLANKITMILLFTIFVAGLVTVVLRRVAAWSLVGQVIALKAVAAGAFLFSRYNLAGSGDLIVLSLVALGFVPGLSVVGLLVMHRCSRFQGTLDVDEEDRLRN